MRFITIFDHFQENVLEIQSHYSTYALASSYFECCSLVSRNLPAPKYLYRRCEIADLESSFVEPLAVDIVALDSTLKSGLLAAVYLLDSTLSWRDISDCGLEMAHVEDIAMSRREVAEADCLGSGLGVDHYMMDRLVDTDDFVRKYFAVDLLVLSAAATISSWVATATVAAEILSMISFVEAVGMVSRMALVPDVAGDFDS